ARHAGGRAVAPLLAGGGRRRRAHGRKADQSRQRLGEELVLYRDKKKHYGLVGEHCPHRSASLAFGRVDEEGIRCPYHGWKLNNSGRCLEQPAEPPRSTCKDRIKHTAYPVK